MELQNLYFLPVRNEVVLIAFVEEKMAAHLAVTLAIECGIPQTTANRIGYAMVLHDCGKRHIPDSIKNKPGKLSPTEFEVMKTHTILGARMLSSLHGDLGIIARNISLWHHEHYNGKGYWRRNANDLPSYVQIASICDVYVALVSRRVYKQAWTSSKALHYIKDRAGEQFCPLLVKTFLSLMDRRSCNLLCSHKNNIEGD